MTSQSLFHRSLLSTTAIRTQSILRAAKSKSKNKPDYIQGRSTDTPSDPRADVIKKVLYDLPPRPTSEMTEEELERHETIERAWELHQKRENIRWRAELDMKFQKAKSAMDELEQTNETLFKGALTKSRTFLFPLQMKAPTETPPLKGWNYEYSPPEKETEGKKGKV